MVTIPRRKVLITGAAGGMGRACALLFGATSDLILTDVVASSLDHFTEELRASAFDVVVHAGDLSSDELLDALVAEVSDGRPFVLIHTAGLSPSLAGWEAIMAVNLVATEMLLQKLEPALMPGSVAILIASSAGHMMPAAPDIDAVLARPLDPDFFEKIEDILNQMGGATAPGSMGGLSYTLSKRAIHTLCQRRGVKWGAKGVRIVSISPGMILTPMGRSEIANTFGAQQLLDATPVGRAGAPMDVALAAWFLASDAAGFISGTDLLVDGGGTAGMKLALAAEPA